MTDEQRAAELADELEAAAIAVVRFLLPIQRRLDQLPRWRWIKRRQLDREAIAIYRGERALASVEEARAEIARRERLE